MKYVLMYTNRPDLDEAMPAGAGKRCTRRSTAGSKARDGDHRLRRRTAGPETATTVKTGGNGEAVVVDGPFSEAKESVGGFSVIDVPDLDAAIAMVKEWPSLGLPGVAIEIRPMVEDYSQIEETSQLGSRKPRSA